MRRQGLSMHKIAADLNGHGIMGKRGEHFPSRKNLMVRGARFEPPGPSPVSSMPTAIEATGICGNSG